MIIKKGDQFRCRKNIVNLFGWPLYIKDNVYKVIGMRDNDEITLDHIIYANEYQSITKEYIFKNFEKL